MDKKFRSRKFLVTLLVLLGATALAYFGKMGSDVALIYSAAVASYNWANMKEATK